MQHENTPNNLIKVELEGWVWSPCLFSKYGTEITFGHLILVSMKGTEPFFK